MNDDSQSGSATKEGPGEGWEVIHSYSRAEAIADGVLMDVSTVAREAGFRWPVALTQMAWAVCVAWGDDDAERTGAAQDEAGRLWDVVYMASMAARRSTEGLSRVPFTIMCIHGWSADGVAREVELVAHCGPGDAGEPVVTIMTPGED